MPHLTVAENIFIGREPMKGPFLDKKKANADARKLLNSLNIDIDPDIACNKLSVAKQQMVEIAKALSYDSELLVMDEPSAALTENEVQELFRFIRDLRSRGHAIIYISHRLDELPQITDRITVMRDGQYVNTVFTKDVTKEQIISMMVGRVIYEQPKTKSEVPESAPTMLLEVKNLVAQNVKNVSFKLKKGEILGFAGLMGAGRTETMRALFGADPKTGGEVLLNGKPVDIHSPVDAVNLGIGYLSEDRKMFGLAVGLSVSENLCDGQPGRIHLRRVREAQEGPPGHEGVCGKAVHQDAQRAPADQEPVGRQPAEGGHRQVADQELRHPDLRRADPRHRRRRQVRDLPPDGRSGQDGQVRHHDQFGDAGIAPDERPAGRDERGPGDRRTGHRGSHPGKDHDARHDGDELGVLIQCHSRPW